MALIGVPIEVSNRDAIIPAKLHLTGLSCFTRAGYVFLPDQYKAQFADIVVYIVKILT